jgi:hypothetical protein
MKNLGTIDRLLRVILAEICIIAAFFWVTREWQIPLYLIAGVMLFQAGTGSCGLYSLLGWNSCSIVQRKNKNLITAFAAVALLLAVVGSYTSAILTENIFLEDAGALNESYRQTLQSLERGNKENAIAQYGVLEGAFNAFAEKYSQYRPLTVKFDNNFTDDMNNISAMISASEEDIRLGNLDRGKMEMQKAEPMIQRMLSR